MTRRQSNSNVTHGAVPDPKQESLAPHFDIQLGRELRSLLKTKLDGADDSAVALGTRSLSDIFAANLPNQPLSLEAARSVASIQVDGFAAWPIFITYAGGYRDAHAPILNNVEMEQRLRQFYTAGASKIRGAIGEAIRNVGQHGHHHTVIGYHQCVFAPAAVLIKEIAFGKGDGPASRLLMAVVTDEGSGISNPQRSMLHGVGSMAGVDALGMGIEMTNCLSYLVKSSKGEWCLFDGSRQANPEKYEGSNSFKTRTIGEKEKIERVACLDLPAPPKGCQKVMFFAHPSATDLEVREIRERLLTALETMQR